MSFINSIQKQSKKHEFPFEHYEYYDALTDAAIEEIVKADIPDVSKHNLNYDGTRAIDGGADDDRHRASPLDHSPDGQDSRVRTGPHRGGGKPCRSDGAQGWRLPPPAGGPALRRAQRAGGIRINSNGYLKASGVAPNVRHARKELPPMTGNDDTPLWMPSAEAVAASNMMAFMGLVNERHGLSLGGYDASTRIS